MVEGEELRQVAMAIKAGSLAAFGGLVGYLVDVAHSDRKFSWLAYGTFILTAFFVGQVLDSWLPTGMPGRGGLLMVAGTAGYPVLQACRARVVAVVDRMK
jgi:hypothetical protein